MRLQFPARSLQLADSLRPERKQLSRTGDREGNLPVSVFGRTAMLKLLKCRRAAVSLEYTILGSALATAVVAGFTYYAQSLQATFGAPVNIPNPHGAQFRPILSPIDAKVKVQLANMVNCMSMHDVSRCNGHGD